MAVKVCAYPVPTWPLASDAVVIVSVAEKIVSVRLTLVVCVGELESATSNASGVAFTTAVGVPLITPPEDSCNPAGSAPLLTENVSPPTPPVAEKVAV